MFFWRQYISTVEIEKSICLRGFRRFSENESFKVLHLHFLQDEIL